MTTKQNKYNAVATAMRYTGDGKENNERAEIYVIKENCDEAVKAILMRNIYDENIGGAQDISYQICASACTLVADTLNVDDEDDINDSDDIWYENESASIYTDERLSYLNNSNQQEISDKMKELECEDIATACAVWYDDMVRSVALELRDFIIND